MHVPVYCPAEVGVHAMENRGVAVDVKNVIAIASIPIMFVVDEDMPIVLVELAMDIPDMVFVAELVTDILCISIDMLAICEIKLRKDVITIP